MSTAPTSDMVRPKPASTAVVSGRRLIASRCGTAWMRLAPLAWKARPNSAQRASSTRCASAATIGVARIACARTITAGVNSSPRKPSGPACDSSKYIAKPTTTGGRPSSAVHRHDQGAPAGKARQRQHRCQRNADQRREHHSTEAHQQRKFDDRKERFHPALLQQRIGFGQPGIGLNRPAMPLSSVKRPVCRAGGCDGVPFLAPRR